MIAYVPADAEALAPVRAIEALCAEHGVGTGPAALQFSTRDPRISSTVIGVSKPERVTQTIEWATTEIPTALWDAIDDLPFDTSDPEAKRDYKPG